MVGTNALVERRFDALQTSHRASLPVTLLNRRRSLSTIRPPSIFSIFRKRPPAKYEQPKFHFFRLPKELRDMIYAEVFGEPGVFHVFKLWRRMGYIKCPFAQCERRGCVNCQLKDQVPWTLVKTETGYLPYPGSHTQVSGILFSFLESCRRVYTEGIEFIYARNTFDFANPEAFLSFASTIPAGRLATIRSLQILWNGGYRYPIRRHGNRSVYQDPRSDRHLELQDSWDPMWNVIAGQMPALSTLSVRILCGESATLKTEGPSRYQEFYIKPMGGLRGLRKFDLVFEMLPQRPRVLGHERVPNKDWAKMELCESAMKLVTVAQQDREVEVGVVAQDRHRTGRVQSSLLRRLLEQRKTNVLDVGII
jgi:hypothetical protein